MEKKEFNTLKAIALMDEHLRQHINKLRFVREVFMTADCQEILDHCERKQIEDGIYQILEDVTYGFDNVMEHLNKALEQEKRENPVNMNSEEYRRETLEAMNRINHEAEVEEAVV